MTQEQWVLFYEKAIEDLESIKKRDSYSTKLIVNSYLKERNETIEFTLPIDVYWADLLSQYQKELLRCKKQYKDHMIKELEKLQDIK